MAKLNGILFFVDLILGLYFINIGFTPNFVNLAFLDPIKNWIFIGGGALLIISGLMSMSRRNQTYR
jgi:hypothetical protein